MPEHLDGDMTITECMEAGLELDNRDLKMEIGDMIDMEMQYDYIDLLWEKAKVASIVREHALL